MFQFLHCNNIATLCHFVRMLGLKVVAESKTETDIAVSGRRARELHVPHLRVLASLGQQFVVRSLLVNQPVFEHDDIVGIFDRAKSVRNHQDGAIRGEPIEGFLDGRLGNRIQSTIVVQVKAMKEWSEMECKETGKASETLRTNTLHENTMLTWSLRPTDR